MKRIGIAVLGLGWMGQAHSRSMLRIPSLFPERTFQPELVVCADTEAERRERALQLEAELSVGAGQHDVHAPAPYWVLTHCR